MNILVKLKGSVYLNRFTQLRVSYLFLAYLIYFLFYFQNQRESLRAQMEAAISGYSNEKCRSYEFFKTICEDMDIIESDEDEELSETDSDYEVDEEESCPEDEEDTCEENDGNEVEENGEEENEAEEVPESNNKSAEDQLNSSKSEDSSSEEGENEEEDQDDLDEHISKFPKWFLDKLYPAHLPRFFVDLMHLRKYINNPQTEHFPYEDCNQLAKPILSLTYSLLNNVKGNEFVETLNEDGSVRHLFYTYLTRATRVTNVQYVSVEIKEKPKYAFEPENPDPRLLTTIFDSGMPELEASRLFNEIEKLPEDLRLYFVAIVYWLHRSQHCDLIHLQALIVCVVVLRTIDSKIPPERDVKAFSKRFGKILKKERQVRDKEVAEGVKRTIREELKTLPITERIQFIQKSDCYLVQNELLKHFHMPEIFKKKYDLYSSAVLHAFAELQSVVFQLHSLNALLSFPHQAPQMGSLYCGVLLYNLYDVFKTRTDVEYYIRNFIFKDSTMMFDFYLYLWQWCEQFIPSWKRVQGKQLIASNHKKQEKRKRHKEKKAAQASLEKVEDPYADMLSSSDGEDDEFIDLNNKFCTILKVS